MDTKTNENNLLLTNRTHYLHKKKTIDLTVMFRNSRNL